MALRNTDLRSATWLIDLESHWPFLPSLFFFHAASDNPSLSSPTGAHFYLDCYLPWLLTPKYSPTTGTRSRCTSHLSWETTNVSDVCLSTHHMRHYMHPYWCIPSRVWSGLRGYDIHRRWDTLAWYIGPPTRNKRLGWRTMYLGITGGSDKNRWLEYVIPPNEQKKGTCCFVAEATCSGMFGVPAAWEGKNIQPPDVRLFATTACRNTHPVCSTTSTSNSPWLISSCQIWPRCAFFGTSPLQAHYHL